MPIHTEDQLITGNDAAVFATGTYTAVIPPPAAYSPPRLPFLSCSLVRVSIFCVTGELLWLFVVLLGCSISQSTSEQSCSTVPANQSCIKMHL